jgi:hypothetical protein
MSCPRYYINIIRCKISNLITSICGTNITGPKERVRMYYQYLNCNQTKAATSIK